MSLSEIAIIVLVGLFILKPDDFKQLAKSLKGMISYISKLKHEIFNSISDEESEQDKEKTNNYLAKIIKLSGKYEGEYNLPSIKAYYHKLLIEKHTKESDEV
jgi:Sec-independent protein translocase protein TatA